MKNIKIEKVSWTHVSTRKRGLRFSAVLPSKEVVDSYHHLISGVVMDYPLSEGGYFEPTPREGFAAVYRSESEWSWTLLGVFPNEVQAQAQAQKWAKLFHLEEVLRDGEAAILQEEERNLLGGGRPQERGLEKFPPVVRWETYRDRSTDWEWSSRPGKDENEPRRASWVRQLARRAAQRVARRRVAVEFSAEIAEISDLKADLRGETLPPEQRLRPCTVDVRGQYRIPEVTGVVADSSAMGTRIEELVKRHGRSCPCWALVDRPGGKIVSLGFSKAEALGMKVDPPSAPTAAQGNRQDRVHKGADQAPFGIALGDALDLAVLR